jgi:hypothetical protein
MNKETVETAATKYANKLEADGEHPGAWIINNKGFKAGAEWQKEQSANEAIEFADWIGLNSWVPLSKIPFDWYNPKLEKFASSKQLYELWKRTKE